MRVFIESLRVIFHFFLSPSLSLSLCFRAELILKKVFVKTDYGMVGKTKIKRDLIISMRGEFLKFYSREIICYIYTCVTILYTTIKMFFTRYIPEAFSIM